MSCLPSPAAAPSSQAIAPPATRAARGRRVVDAPTRVIHGLLALGFTGAWLTAESDAVHALHVALGYTVALLVGLRIVYGLVGPRHARLSQWSRRIAGTPIVAELEAHDVSRPGEAIEVDLNLNRAALFDAATERAI